MLWSIESCQNKVSADQYHLAVSWALLSTHPGRVFFDVIRFKLLVFRGSQAQLEVYFLKFIWIVLCLCHYGPALLTFWFQTNFGRENSASYLKMQAGKTDAFHFSHHSHALVTLHVQYLCPDWSKFDRWFTRKILTWNLFALTAEADRVLWQPVMFLTVFFDWMYKMKYSCYLKNLLLFMIGFFIGLLFEKCAACQSRNSISDGIVFVFHLVGCVRGL